MRFILAALVAAASPAASGVAASTDAQRQWAWTSGEADVRQLTVRIARGSYRIVLRPGPVVVSMSVRGPAADRDAVHFDVETGRNVTITDIYPAAGLRSWEECLPPADARGAFWASNALIEAVIEAPPSLPVVVEVMDLRSTAIREEPQRPHRVSRK